MSEENYELPSLHPIKISNKLTYKDEKCNLIASHCGVLANIDENGINLFSTKQYEEASINSSLRVDKVIDVKKIMSIPIDNPCYWLEFNCNGSILAVAMISKLDNVLHIKLYDISNFLSNKNGLIGQYDVKDGHLNDFKWHPNDSKMLSMVINETCSLCVVDNNSIRCLSSKSLSYCVSWSPKGKQLSVLMKSSPTGNYIINQYDLTMAEKRSTEINNIKSHFGVSCDLLPTDLCWISTFNFIIAFHPDVNDADKYKVYSCSFSSKKNKFETLRDIRSSSDCIKIDSGVSARLYSLHIIEWNLTVLVNNTAEQLALYELCADDELRLMSTYCLPMEGNIVGMCADFSSDIALPSKMVKSTNKSPTSHPIVFFQLSDGTCFGIYIITTNKTALRNVAKLNFTNLVEVTETTIDTSTNKSSGDKLQTMFPNGLFAKSKQPDSLAPVISEQTKDSSPAESTRTSIFATQSNIFTTSTNPANSSGIVLGSTQTNIFNSGTPSGTSPFGSTQGNLFGGLPGISSAIRPTANLGTQPPSQPTLFGKNPLTDISSNNNTQSGGFPGFNSNKSSAAAADKQKTSLFGPQTVPAAGPPSNLSSSVSPGTSTGRPQNIFTGQSSFKTPTQVQTDSSDLKSQSQDKLCPTDAKPSVNVAPLPTKEAVNRNITDKTPQNKSTSSHAERDIVDDILSEPLQMLIKQYNEIQISTRNSIDECRHFLSSDLMRNTVPRMYRDLDKNMAALNKIILSNEIVSRESKSLSVDIDLALEFTTRCKCNLEDIRKKKKNVPTAPNPLLTKIARNLEDSRKKTDNHLHELEDHLDCMERKRQEKTTPKKKPVAQQIIYKTLYSNAKVISLERSKVDLLKKHLKSKDSTDTIDIFQPTKKSEKQIKNVNLEDQLLQLLSKRMVKQMTSDSISLNKSIEGKQPSDSKATKLNSVNKTQIYETKSPLSTQKPLNAKLVDKNIYKSHPVENVKLEKLTENKGNTLVASGDQFSQSNIPKSTHFTSVYNHKTNLSSGDSQQSVNTYTEAPFSIKTSSTLHSTSTSTPAVNLSPSSIAQTKPLTKRNVEGNDGKSSNQQQNLPRKTETLVSNQTPNNSFIQPKNDQHLKVTTSSNVLPFTSPTKSTAGSIFETTVPTTTSLKLENLSASTASFQTSIFNTPVSNIGRISKTPLFSATLDKTDSVLKSALGRNVLSTQPSTILSKGIFGTSTIPTPESSGLSAATSLSSQQTTGESATIDLSSPATPESSGSTRLAHQLVSPVRQQPGTPMNLTVTGRSGGLFGSSTLTVSKSSTAQVTGGLFESTSSTAPSSVGIFGSSTSTVIPTGGQLGSAGSFVSKTSGVLSTAPQTSVDESVGSTTPATPKTGGLFGSNTSTTPQTGGIFGSNTSSSPQTGGIFGSATSTTPQTGAVFGSNTASSPQGGGIFGSATSTTPQTGGLFGSNTSTTPQTGGVFGSTTASSPQSGGIFGSTTSTTPQTSGLFGSTTSTTPQTGGLFGSNTSTTPKTGGVFGSNTSTTPQTGGIFGSNTSSSPQIGGIFGSATSTTPQTGAVFGSNTSSSPQTGGIFGSTTSTTPQTGGLFGSATSTTPQTGGLFGSATSTTPQTGGLFGSTTSTTPQTGGIFGSSTSTTPQTGGIFGSNTSTTPQTGGLFGSNTSTTPQTGGLFGSTATTSGGLFGSSQNSFMSGLGGSSNNQTSNVFGSNVNKSNLGNDFGNLFKKSSGSTNIFNNSLSTNLESNNQTGAPLFGSAPVLGSDASRQTTGLFSNNVFGSGNPANEVSFGNFASGNTSMFDNNNVGSTGLFGNPTSNGTPFASHISPSFTQRRM